MLTKPWVKQENSYVSENNNSTNYRNSEPKISLPSFRQVAVHANRNNPNRMHSQSFIARVCHLYLCCISKLELVPKFPYYGIARISPSTSTGRSNFFHRQPVEMSSCGGVTTITSLLLCKIPNTLIELPSLTYLSNVQRICSYKFSKYISGERMAKRSSKSICYPSSRRSKRASDERFLSLNHFLK